MAMDHIVKHTCRFNIKNPQHRRVNEILSKLSPEVCKSKSQFMITATEYYIDHFGEEAFVAAPKDNSAYVTKTELVLISIRLPITTMRGFIPMRIRTGWLHICES